MFGPLGFPEDLNGHNIDSLYTVTVYSAICIVIKIKSYSTTSSLSCYGIKCVTVLMNIVVQPNHVTEISAQR